MAGEHHNAPEDNNGSLRQAVERAMEKYFEDLGNEDLVRNLYDVVLSEVEAPLLQAVLKNTAGNQSKASTMLGLNRGTLRKKMKQYGLLD
ncbi:MAG: DNA-binding transcriptional regulator Fis [Pseudohongiella sp.]|nr:DNA-binding transcriptional regulator Fis [Pseudohongiella sp.]MDO9520433.1 DNA-binding transcriptional regulator Fis [Pseudohongiella sp.]MDP2126558.1 DNA-binding transcriptional regulator Fis [Pseudohongiella sp.]